MRRAPKYITRLTPEKMEEMRLERLKEIKSMSLEFQLGIYVGEYIVHRYLPTLSSDIMTSRNVIQVSKEETEEQARLSDIWYTKTHKVGKGESKKEWDEYILYSKELEKKYLPHTLVCYVHPLNITNEKDFKKGLKSALWNCDMCSYKCTLDEDIIIEEDTQGYFTCIKLDLDMSVNLSSKTLKD